MNTEDADFFESFSRVSREIRNSFLAPRLTPHDLSPTKDTNVIRSDARFWVAALAALVLSGAVGCGGGKTAPVNGRVKFKDGSDSGVLAGYLVNFEAEAAGEHGSSMGEIQPDGSFKLSTFGADDGAIPGKYRIAITPPSSPDPDKPPPKSKIPAKYESFDTSGLTQEIKPGTNNIELELERAK
jgi:hypothetical protein